MFDAKSRAKRQKDKQEQERRLQEARDRQQQRLADTQAQKQPGVARRGSGLLMQALQGGQSESIFQSQQPGCAPPRPKRAPPPPPQFKDVPSMFGD